MKKIDVEQMLFSRVVIIDVTYILVLSENSVEELWSRLYMQFDTIKFPYIVR